MSDFVEGGVEVLLTGDAPDFVEGGVEVLLSNAPSRPAWIPLYVFDKEWGWLPTFPRWLFDQHPPRN